MLLSTDGDREYWRGEPPADSASGEKALRRLDGLRFFVIPDCDEMDPRFRGMLRLGGDAILFVVSK